MRAVRPVSCVRFVRFTRVVRPFHAWKSYRIFWVDFFEKDDCLFAPIDVVTDDPFRMFVIPDQFVWRKRAV